MKNLNKNETKSKQNLNILSREGWSIFYENKIDWKKGEKTSFQEQFLMLCSHKIDFLKNNVRSSAFSQIYLGKRKATIEAENFANSYFRK